MNKWSQKEKSSENKILNNILINSADSAVHKSPPINTVGDSPL